MNNRQVQKILLSRCSSICNDEGNCFNTAPRPDVNYILVFFEVEKSISKGLILLQLHRNLIIGI